MTHSVTFPVANGCHINIAEEQGYSKEGKDYYLTLLLYKDNGDAVVLDQIQGCHGMYVAQNLQALIRVAKERA